MKMWGKLWKNNHMLRDTVVTIDDDDTRTHKVFKALDEICLQFDLERSIWLESTIKDFQRRSKCRFGRDCFIEEKDFDYLELQVLEE